MVDRRKAFSLISSRDHYQRFSPSRISDMLRAGSEPAQNLSSGFIEWSCAVVITTTPWRHETKDTKTNKLQSPSCLDISIRSSSATWALKVWEVFQLNLNYSILNFSIKVLWKLCYVKCYVKVLEALQLL